MSSSNVSHHNISSSSPRALRPSLINTNVQDFSDLNNSMEIEMELESTSRKRSLPLATSEIQGNIKTKKALDDVSTVPRDSLNAANAKVKTLYSNSDCPPYIIHVYSLSENSSSSPAHPLLISRRLSQIAYSDIKEIKRIGRGKVLAEMKSMKAANSLVQNLQLEKENLKAFIPTYRTIRTGIVRDILQHFDESELLQFFDSPFKVVEVKRLNRRMRIHSETKYIPSRTICLKFAGQILPKYVFFCQNRYDIFPFVSKVKICFACYKIGHISKNCRGKPRCIFCGGDAHDSTFSCSSKNESPSCINCQGGHLATSHDCPMITKHKMILS